MPQQILIIRPPINKISSQAIVQMPNVVRMIEQAKPQSIERVLDHCCWTDHDEQLLKTIDLRIPTTILFLNHLTASRIDDYTEALRNFINAAQNIGYIMVSDPEASQQEQNDMTYFCGRLQKYWEGTPVKVLTVNVAQPALTEEQQKSLVAICEGKLSDKDREKVGRPKMVEPTSTKSVCQLL